MFVACLRGEVLTFEILACVEAPLEYGCLPPEDLKHPAHSLNFDEKCPLMSHALCPVRYYHAAVILACNYALAL